MTINGINSANTQAIQKTKNDNIDKSKQSNEEIKNNGEIVDKFEKSDVKANATYEKPVYKRDEETIAKLKAKADQTHQNLKNLVETMLKKQGLTFRDLKIGGKDIKIDEETRLEAQKAIADGGPLSVENVSDDLVNFAKALSGGDKSKFDLLKGAIEKGFDAARKAFGGQLPDISQKTFERTMEKLEAWKNEGNETEKDLE